MMDLRKFGNPIEFWTYFYEISKIPRCSQKEEKIREFVKSEANKFNYEVKVDDIGNIVIKIPSKQDSAKTNIVLQSHMDMVCEKNKSVEHDFSKDALKLMTIQENDETWLTADGTTLGADNAVGMAYQLAIMKKIYDGSLSLGLLNLNLLFTVDEERGLSGASQMDKSLIEGDYLINLDSEEDDEFTIGCAGGRVFSVEIEKVSEEGLLNNDVIPIKIAVSGLIGGHSGMDINKGRGNAVKILIEILWKIDSNYNISISSIEGGNLSNAIPREASAIFHINKSDKLMIESFIKELNLNIKSIYLGIEPDLTIKIEEITNVENNTRFNDNFQHKLINLFNLIPTGPISHHPTSKGLVHTSLNFASVHTLEDRIEIKISTRSLTEYDKDTLFERIKALLIMTELIFKIVIETVYPSWSPNFDSDIVKVSKKLYKEVFNEEVRIKAIHAGLECAFFSHYYPEMQMISIGPDIVMGHSPDEKLRIKSVEKIWNFLIKFLEQLVTIS
jgi:dipeptidase D